MLAKSHAVTATAYFDIHIFASFNSALIAISCFVLVIVLLSFDEEPPRESCRCYSSLNVSHEAFRFI